MTSRIVALLLSVVPVVACGSIDQSTACKFESSCGAPSATNVNVGDASAPDVAVDSGCKPGETKSVDCNTCVCSARGVFECTTLGCPDTGPPPSTCPSVAPKGGGHCVGKTHCIYTSPCAFGCDCVDGEWKCVDCGG